MKEAYIKCIFDLIFSGELAEDINGYLVPEPEWLLQFPIHNKMAQLFKLLYMKTFQDIIIYGGKYESRNWWYDYWDADNIVDVANGNFTFQIGVIIEKDNMSNDCRCAMRIKNYDIFSMTITDHDNKEHVIIKDGKINDNNT